ncbi:hypothetical protein [Paenibacillus sp. MBLB4367]|uniref:hypothetical protein n=1 Tax=Paenibacillus sp. MBLB4367 TaxID=3384767 RepID=UPI003907ECFD
MPTNTAKIRVYASTKVTLNQGVYFYADEIKLTEAENVLKNGSFENGMTSWAVDDASTVFSCLSAKHILETALNFR